MATNSIKAGSTKFWDRLADVFLGDLNEDEKIPLWGRFLISFAGVLSYIIGYALITIGTGLRDIATKRTLSGPSVIMDLYVNLILIALFYSILFYWNCISFIMEKG